MLILHHIFGLFLILLAMAGTAMAGSFSYELTHDAISRVTQVVVDEENQAAYRYHPDGRLKKVVLGGSGTMPPPVEENNITLSSSYLSFPIQTLAAQGTTQTMTITNPGDSVLTLSNITVSGDFSKEDDCPADLEAGASCTVSVTFSPLAEGERSGTLSIESDAPDGPHNIELMGTGYQPRTGLKMASAIPVNGTYGYGTDRNLELSFTVSIFQGESFSDISLTDGDGEPAGFDLSITGDRLLIAPDAAFAPLTTYTLTLPDGSLKDADENLLVTTQIVFTTGNDRHTVGVAALAGCTSESFNMMLKGNGTVLTWGRDLYGQLGLGHFGGAEVLTPSQIPGLMGIKAISCGRNHGLALRHDGTVLAWGGNFSRGTLGNNSSINSALPIRVFNLQNIVQIAAGEDHSLALDGDGNVWAWGENFGGQVGNGTLVDQPVPVLVSDLNNIKSIDAGYTFSVALDNNGEVWAWGYNPGGNLGTGSTEKKLPNPTQVPGLTEVRAIAVGSNHILASTGDVWGWGMNDNGQSGEWRQYGNTIPEKILRSDNITLYSENIIAGGRTSFALRSGGHLWAWGNNSGGQFGNGETAYQNRKAIDVTPLDGIVSVTAGDVSTLALLNNGTVWGWGHNFGGSIGDGTTEQRLTPVIIPVHTGPGAIEIEDITITVLEEEKHAVVTVVRTQGQDDDASVDFITYDGIANSGEDFHFKTGTVHFASGENRTSFTIDIIDDELIEIDESFTVALSNPTSGAILGSQTTATVSIVSNDGPGQLQFAQDTFTVQESDGIAQLKVVRSRGKDGQIAVGIVVTDETALSEEDYLLLSDQLVFQQDELEKTVLIRLQEDSEVENIETFTIELVNPTGGAELSSPSQSTVQISEQEAGIIEFGAASYSVTEDGGSVVVDVIRRDGTDGIVKVVYATQDGSATNDLDYQKQSGELVFQDGETSKNFSVSIYPDSLSETTETINLTLDITSDGGRLGQKNRGIINILDAFFVENVTEVVTQDVRSLTSIAKVAYSSTGSDEQTNTFDFIVPEDEAWRILSYSRQVSTNVNSPNSQWTMVENLRSGESIKTTGGEHEATMQMDANGGDTIRFTTYSYASAGYAVYAESIVSISEFMVAINHIVTPDFTKTAVSAGVSIFKRIEYADFSSSWLAKQLDWEPVPESEQWIITSFSGGSSMSSNHHKNGAGYVNFGILSTPVKYKIEIVGRSDHFSTDTNNQGEFETVLGKQEEFHGELVAHAGDIVRLSVSLLQPECNTCDLGITDISANLGSITKYIKKGLTSSPVESTQSSATIQAGGVGQTVGITIHAKDQSGHVISWGGDNVEVTVTGANGFQTLPVTDNLDGTYETSYVPEQFGTDQIEITLNEGILGGQSYQVFIAPNENTSPTVATSIGSQVANEDVLFEFIIPNEVFVDSDPGDSLQITAQLVNGEELPAWLMFDPTSLTFTGTPTNEDVGIQGILVTATDVSGSTVSDVFQLSVQNTNDAPTLHIPLLNHTAEDSVPILFQIPTNTFTDMDVEDGLSFQAEKEDGTDLPSWLVFNQENQSFTGTPKSSDIGSLNVRIIATDQTDVPVSDTFTLVVTDTNNAPIDIKTVDKPWRIRADGLFEISASAFQENGTIGEYHWDFGDNNTAIGQVVNHTYDAPGFYLATLTVTTSGFRTTQRRIPIQVEEARHTLSGNLTGESEGMVRLIAFSTTTEFSGHADIFVPGDGIPTPFTIDSLKPASDYYLLLESEIYASGYWHDRSVEAANSFVKWNRANTLDISNGDLDIADALLQTGRSIHVNLNGLSSGDTVELTAWSESSDGLDMVTIKSDGDSIQAVLKGLPAANDFRVRVDVLGGHYRSGYYAGPNTPLGSYQQATILNMMSTETITIQHTLTMGATIAGNITGLPQGQMAWVRVWSEKRQWGDGVEITGSGELLSYSINGLPPARDFRVCLESEALSGGCHGGAERMVGYTQAVPIDVRQGDQYDVNLILESGYSIGGTVTGISLGNTAWIEAWSPSRMHWTQTQVNQGGSYLLMGLSAVHDYQISLRTQELLYAPVQSVDLTAGDVHEVDFSAIPAGEIEGIISGLYEGDVITVRAWSLATQHDAQVTLVASNSEPLSYRLEGLIDAEDYRVSINSSRGRVFYAGSDGSTFEPNKAVQVTLSSSENVTDINFDLTSIPSTYQLSGQISGLDTPGLSEVPVTLRVWSETGVHESTTRHGNGLYMLQGLPTGNYKVSVSAPDFQDIFFSGASPEESAWSLDPNTATLLVVSNASVTLDVPLKTEEHRIFGTITDAQDLPVSGVVINVWDNAQKVGGQAETDFMGYFEISGLPDGNYYVEAHAGEGDYVGQVILAENSVETSFQLVKRTGRISGTIANIKGHQAIVLVYDSATEQFLGMAVATDGVFTFENIEIGKAYRLDVEWDGNPAKMEDSTLVTLSSSTPEVSVDVSRSNSVFGLMPWGSGTLK